MKIILMEKVLADGRIALAHRVVLVDSSYAEQRVTFSVGAFLSEADCVDLNVDPAEVTHYSASGVWDENYATHAVEIVAQLPAFSGGTVVQIVQPVVEPPPFLAAMPLSQGIEL